MDLLYTCHVHAPTQENSTWGAVMSGKFRVSRTAAGCAGRARLPAAPETPFGHLKNDSG